MSDFTTGREIRDDLAPPPEADRLAEANARGAMAAEAQPAQKTEVGAAAEAPALQHTTAPWYMDERGHIRDPGTDIIIATLVDPDGMIPDDEQMANGRLIERAPLLHAAAARALDYLTDHGIDLDGPEEEIVAGIRAELDEALGNDVPRHTGGERAPRVVPEPDIPAPEPGAGGRVSLPPDPEGMNDRRSDWAHAAIRHFQIHTGTDWQDALSDLLGDLMHFADRHGFDFHTEMDRGRFHYEAETLPLPDIESEPVPERPQTPTRDLEDTITAQIDAAQEVIDNWSSGDLAGAVNGLEEVTEAARATLRAASLERPAAAPDRQPDLPGRQETMTQDAIDRDHGKAVSLDLPADASRDLLQDVYTKAERLERMRSDDIAVADTPAEADALARKAEQAAARMDEVRARLDEAPAPDVSASIGGEIFGERMGLAAAVSAEDTAARISALESERDRFVIGAPDGTETHDPDEWRRQNRKDAEELDRVHLAEREPVPPQISDGLTEAQKADLADAILSRMVDMHSHYDIDERNGGFALVRTFEMDDASLREYGLPEEQQVRFADTLDAMREKIINRDGPFFIPELVREPPTPAASVEREPMTLEAIARDPMNALLLPLPPDMSPETAALVVETTARLRDHFEDAAQHLGDAADGLRSVSSELSRQFGETRELLMEAADDAQLRMQTVRDDFDLAEPPYQAREPMTLEAIARDPMNADLERHAEKDGAFALPSGRVQTPEQAAEAAASRVADLDQRIERVREPAAELETTRLTDELHERAEVETRAPHGGSGILDGILNGHLFRDPLTKHMRGTAELIANVLIGYFVSEPELTPQQVHDLTRANAERDESRAVELKAREADAGLIATNCDVNHNRSPVPCGACDEVRRGESVFDRYPGLTRDDSGGTQEHESDRAFYDMGIERDR